MLPPVPQVAPPQQSAPRNPQAQDPEKVRAMLVDVLSKAKQMAEENGIPFEDVVQEVMGGGAGKPNLPAPPPIS